MGTLIKEMLDTTTLHMLTLNSSPNMIHQENVGQATKALVKAIKLLELYPSHQALIDRFEPLRRKYPSIHAHRTLYLWQLSQAGFQLMSLNLSDADFLRSNLLKCQASFLSVLFDDICDLGRDKAVFDKCVLALKGQVNQDNVEMYQLIADTWFAIQNIIKQTPNYALLKPTLEEAYREWIGSFEYCFWLEESPRFEEKWEKRLEIVAHTSLLYLAGLIDLLFVPNLSAQQASTAAQVFLRTQKMVQIANWATTWGRELAQQDFTSGVFSMALKNGWVEWNDLKNESSEKVRQKIRNSPAENYLWNEWERLRVEGLQIVKEIQLPALEEYVESLSPMTFLLVASAGEFSDHS